MALTMKLFGRRSAALLLAVSMIVAAHYRPAEATALGMTPNHVVGQWTNVNECLLTVAHYAADRPDLQDSLAAMSHGQFENKTPRDVLEQVVSFRAKLDRLRNSSKLSATRVYETQDETITPSHVFLNSGLALNALVEWLIVNSEKDQLVSQFYAHHEFSGKTPNDAFAMVELANRRLDSILAAASL